jgi:hypothetical protein
MLNSFRVEISYGRKVSRYSRWWIKNLNVYSTEDIEKLRAKVKLDTYKNPISG